ncbi:MAG: glycosyltransferase family 2 protein [Kiritimatiellae bacterium]|nr:glycosyltransferase family 2 protein [Kiritimatiellia bacterium]
MDATEFTIVLPVYYNEASLEPAYEDLKSAIEAAKPAWRGRLLYVDDGSGDGSFDVLRRIQARGEVPVTLVKLSRNFGQVMAIRAGIAHAETPVVIVMSADGQEPASLVGEMLAAHAPGGAEVAICTRSGREEGLYRTWTSKAFYGLMRRFCFRDMPLGGFDCFLLGAKAKAAFLDETERQPFLQGQILGLGFSRTFIPYVRLSRKFGVSRWTFWKKLAYFFDGLMNYSFAPIRFVSFLGFALAGMGLLYALVVFFAKILVGNPVQGWTPLMIAILVLGGAQMLTLGIFGEYLWRILVQAQHRAPYVVETIVRGAEET